MPYTAPLHTYTPSEIPNWEESRVAYLERELRKLEEVSKAFVVAIEEVRSLAGGGSGISDGDKGDITVSGGGTVWAIDADAVTYSKVQDVSATDRVLGRASSGAGIIEEITCTAAGRALLDDASAADQRTTLGLGTAAQSNTGDFATSSHTHPSTDITDFAEAVDDRVNALLVPGANVSLTYDDVTNTMTIAAAGGGGVADGDKGDVVVSGGGAAWTLDTKPSFSVHRNSVDQASAATSTATKIQFTTEEFDVGGYFDAATNYRFTPGVAGKYLLTASATILDVQIGTTIYCAVYKNGVLYKIGDSVSMGTGPTYDDLGTLKTPTAQVTCIVDMNGSTDYVEFYAWHNHGSSRSIEGDAYATYAQGMWLGY